MEFLANYGLFLAKSITLLVFFLFAVAGLIALSSKGRKEPDGHVEIEILNDKYKDIENSMKQAIFSQEQLKEAHKQEKKQIKEEKKNKKNTEEESRKRVFVLNFDGDVRASAVENLREEITAVLTMATPEDEVVLCLESPGGMVHGYGLAASQLERITKKDIPLTVAVDAVAASGGYMMACIGTKIIAAPFAIIGSIGVVAQLPNFHRLLKKNNVDYEMFTAGEYKRTVTMFGENTDKGREKFVEELEDTHELFKAFVSRHRPQVNIAEVATGEIWYGSRAIECQLVDDLQTSDEYLMSLRDDAELYSISYEHKKSLQEKLGIAAAVAADSVLGKVFSRFRQERFYQ